MILRLFQYVVAIVLAGVLAGCGGSAGTSGTGSDKAASGHNPVKVVATVGMVADIVRQVGGKHISVTQICGSGVDPHLYKVTRDDVKTIMGGDIVFYSGLMLEGKMTDTLVKVARSKPVIAVTEGIPETSLLEPEDFAGHYDPHVWMDVSAWSECVAVVADSLAKFDPNHAEAFRSSAAEYRQQLSKLHEYGGKAIATIPDGSRVLITSHDAFNYFGRAYGLEVLGVQGLSTESEAGLQHINELVDLLVERDIAAVFVESSVPRKNIDALAEGARSRGHDVKIGGELYSDAMGSEGTYEGTYIGMLDHNITLVARMLGGEAPAEGFQGKLKPD
ncbi:MAG: zinc ABC transporter substrate-binding protein [Planctomycetaceae bacterium]